jgi:hypothetical protein
MNIRKDEIVASMGNKRYVTNPRREYMSIHTSQDHRHIFKEYSESDFPGRRNSNNEYVPSPAGTLTLNAIVNILEEFNYLGAKITIIEKANGYKTCIGSDALSRFRK